MRCKQARRIAVLMDAPHISFAGIIRRDVFQTIEKVEDEMDTKLYDERREAARLLRDWSTMSESQARKSAVRWCDALMARYGHDI